MEIVVGFYQVEDFLDQTDNPHDEWPSLDQGAEDRHEKHDEALFRVPQIKLMDPETSQKDSQDTGDDPVFAADSHPALAQTGAALDADDLIRLGGSAAVGTEFFLQ
jgi:hypothetical protein